VVGLPFQKEVSSFFLPVPYISRNKTKVFLQRKETKLTLCFQGTPSHHMALAQIQRRMHTSMSCHHQREGEMNIWHLVTQMDKGSLNQEVWSMLPRADKPVSPASCRKAALHKYRPLARANHFVTIYSERYPHGYKTPVTSKGSGWLQTSLKPFQFPPEVSW